MTARVTRLTSEQEAEIARIRNEWVGIGLATEPADREEAERGVDLAYRTAGLEPPAIKIWLRSPFEGVIGAAMLRQSLEVWAQVWAQVGAQVGAQVWAQVRAQVRAQVWAQVGAQVGAQVWDQVRDQVRDQVGDQVWDQVRAQVGDQVRAQVWAQVGAQVGAQVWDQVGDQVGDQVRAQVGDQVWDQVRDQVRAQVRAQVRDQVGAQVHRCGYGQHDASWLAFYDFFAKACGLESTQPLEGLWTIARSCGWWWPFQGLVILTERHRIVRRDEQGRLHAEDGPALEYPDGFALWRWHGVRVPQQVITASHTLTAEQIRDERNLEVRRIMIERFGQERYLRESNARQVHRDDFGTLWRCDIPNDEPLVMVNCVNSTPEPDGSFRDFYLRVPPTVRTAREAIAWTFQMTEEEYSPVVET